MVLGIAMAIEIQRLTGIRGDFDAAGLAVAARVARSLSKKVAYYRCRSLTSRLRGDFHAPPWGPDP
jgi:hypothetical protein